MIDSDFIRKMGGVNPQPLKSNSPKPKNLILLKRYIIPRK